MDRWATSGALPVPRLFDGVLEAGNVQVEAHGNVLVAAAFYYGMATEELTKEELDFNNRDYEVLITIRAVKTTDQCSNCRV